MAIIKPSGQGKSTSYSQSQINNKQQNSVDQIISLTRQYNDNSSLISYYAIGDDIRNYCEIVGTSTLNYSQSAFLNCGSTSLNDVVKSFYTTTDERSLYHYIKNSALVDDDEEFYNHHVIATPLISLTSDYAYALQIFNNEKFKFNSKYLCYLLRFIVVNNKTSVVNIYTLEEMKSSGLISTYRQEERYCAWQMSTNTDYNCYVCALGSGLYQNTNSTLWLFNLMKNQPFTYVNNEEVNIGNEYVRACKIDRNGYVVDNNIPLYDDEAASLPSSVKFVVSGNVVDLDIDGEKYSIGSTSEITGATAITINGTTYSTGTSSTIEGPNNLATTDQIPSKYIKEVSVDTTTQTLTLTYNDDTTTTFKGGPTNYIASVSKTEDGTITWKDQADASTTYNPTDYALSLAAGSNITLTQSNNQLVISATGGGGGLTSVIGWSGYQQVYTQSCTLSLSSGVTNSPKLILFGYNTDSSSDSDSPSTYIVYPGSNGYLRVYDGITSEYQFWTITISGSSGSYSITIEPNSNTESVPLFLTSIICYY